MDHQSGTLKKTDKDSGIVKDANLRGIETENNPKYPLVLFQKVITASLKKVKIVKGLPKWEVFRFWRAR